MARIETSSAARAAQVEAPKSNALELAARVFDAAASSPDPAVVLQLGSAEGPQKGYRVLAMRLHPDRATGASDADKGRLEEAFKLAKAAWEACPANADSTRTAAEYYESARPKRATSAPPPTPPRADAYGRPPPTSAADREAAEAFMRAQAEAAARAAEAARRGAEAAQEAALASARMGLDGTAGALKDGLATLKKLLERPQSAAVGEALRALSAHVAKLPLTLTPPLDPMSPDARLRLAAFEEGTVRGLRSARESLPKLARDVETVRAGQAQLTAKLGELRRAHVMAKGCLAQLVAHAAPPAEVKKWETRLAKQSEAIEQLAGAVKDETRALAELDRELQKQAANVPYLERQVHERRPVSSGEAALASAFGLKRAPFGADEVEWQTRIGLLEKGLTGRLDTLEQDVMLAMGSAHAGSFASLRSALVVLIARPAADAARLAASLGDDVRGALSPALRARAEGLFADLATLGQAFTDRARRGGPQDRAAVRVSGLSTPKVEARWNQEVNFAVSFEKQQDEARWARRDPTKFY